MPTFKDVTIHITSLDGAPLAEFGLQTLQKSGKISCFIESKSNLPFRISVSPTIPFPAFTSAAAEQQQHGSDNRGSTAFGSGFGDTYRPSYPSSAYDPRRSDDGTAYHLLATLRLDGREKAEKRSIVYLNPENEWFDPVVVMKGRLAYDEQGGIRESGWVFREVGIEDLLGTLGLEGQEKEEEVKGEEGLAKAFEKLGKDRLDDEGEKNASGKIEVTLERVRIKTVRRGGWKPDAPSSSSSTTRTTGNNAAGDKKASLKDLSHLTSSTTPTGDAYTEVDAIEYNYVDGPNAAPWATFTFFYRGKETMAKLGFPGFAVNAEVPGRTGKGAEAERKLVGGKRGMDGEGEGSGKRQGFGMGEIGRAKEGEEGMEGEDEEL